MMWAWTVFIFYKCVLQYALIQRFFRWVATSAAGAHNRVSAPSAGGSCGKDLCASTLRISEFRKTIHFIICETI